jgi:hypothetical protein
MGNSAASDFPSPSTGINAEKNTSQTATNQTQELQTKFYSTMAFQRKLSATLGGLQLAASSLMTPYAKTLLKCRSMASNTNEDLSMQKLYKSLGMKPPLPRKVTPDAQKLHDE